MKILHLVPGLGNAANGIAVAAKRIAAEQGAVLADCTCLGDVQIACGDEVWVHSMWTPPVWRACRWTLRRGARLVRMTHGCLDPFRLRYHGWKKRLVSPIERALFRRCARVVVTCAEEESWCRTWGVKGPFELIDLRRSFSFGRVPAAALGGKRPLHVLYLGRPHPLKGVVYLERAVRAGTGIELREVCDHFGAELDADWAWCDVLVLPTLSENFGLVVAEALERGKRVITTDGAPVWENQPGVVYLKGYRAGTDAERVRLLVQALEQI